MEIPSIPQSSSGGGSVTVTLSGTFQGDYAKITIYFDAAATTEIHPNLVIYERGGVEGASDKSDSCGSHIGNDCTSVIVNPVTKKISFNNQLLDNQIEGSYTYMSGLVQYPPL